MDATDRRADGGLDTGRLDSVLTRTDPVRGRLLLADIGRVHLIDQSLNVIEKRLVSLLTELGRKRCMNVLAYVHAIDSEEREERLEGHDLVGPTVAAIINDDVKRSFLGVRNREKYGRIALIADGNSGVESRKIRATGIDVQAMYISLGTEVATPDLERPPVLDPDLEETDRQAAVSRQMAVVDLEVVVPLVRHEIAVLVERPLHMTFGCGAKSFALRLGCRREDQHCECAES